jgi:hypothetical protein
MDFICREQLFLPPSLLPIFTFVRQFFFLAEAPER